MRSLFSLAAAQVASALTLNVASSGGNSSSSLLYGMLYEDIYHSGDGGLYGELIRNRAFQGSSSDGAASLDRNTDYWHAVGDVTLAIDTSTPVLSSSLPYQMRMDVPTGTTGTVGFYNDGFWGFDVNATKRYIASFYMRGDYSGTVECYFENTISGEQLSSASIAVDQSSTDGWVQSWTSTFYPTESAANPNNTFYFTFNGTELAGKSVYFNLLSVFKQTYLNRDNGVREDLAEALAGLGAAWIRLPGGSNMEGLYSPYYWNWNETIGSLTARPGRPGVWGDINTDGFGILEMMQMAQDLDLTVILGLWAGLYLDSEVISESDIGTYVDSALDLLEFLTGDSSTTYGAKRIALGYTDAFTVDYVEIGNEDYLDSGTSSYYSYRFTAFYDAIRSQYPSMNVVSTINPNPSGTTGSGGMIDLHIYENQNTFVDLFNTFDQANRSFPVFVGEYASIRENSVTSGQVGAQTFGMACAEAIFLLGCERNSDVILGTSYGALIKEYNEEPGTVAVIKHTANDILFSMSYYVQKLFGAHVGTETLPVTTTSNFGPVYWSATTDGTSTILKLVNYDGLTGTENAVEVVVDGSSATSAQLTFLTAPASTSVNNFPELGGEVSIITTETIDGESGKFNVTFTESYQIAVLVI